MPTDRICTISQAARALRLPVRALRALIADGEVPYIRAGDELLVDLTSFEQALIELARRHPGSDRGKSVVSERLNGKPRKV